MNIYEKVNQATLNKYSLFLLKHIDVKDYINMYNNAVIYAKTGKYVINDCFNEDMTLKNDLVITMRGIQNSSYQIFLKTTYYENGVKKQKTIYEVTSFPSVLKERTIRISKNEYKDHVFENECYLQITDTFLRDPITTEIPTLELTASSDTVGLYGDV